MLGKVLVIGGAAVGAIVTTVLALAMLSSDLQLPYLVFKVWLFGVVPTIFGYMAWKERKKGESGEKK